MTISNIPSIGNIYNQSTTTQSVTANQNVNVTSPAVKNDAFSSNPLLANTTPPATTDIANKKAGFGQRLFNNIGNAFGKIADMAGLGTIAHYAKQNFQTYDTNKSNSVDVNEFSAVSQMIGKSFQQVDTNSNQQISLGEFKKIVGDLVDANFKAADTNSDGFLNLNEAGAGGYVAGTANNNSFQAHDSNKDALLSRNEFAGLVNDMKLRKK